MRAIRTAFAGIIAGLITLATPGQALPTTAPEPRTAVCETGFRGQPDYDRLCLVPGTRAIARDIWYGQPAPRRTYLCYVALVKGMRTVVADQLGDMISDTYRNDRIMANNVTGAGIKDCARRMR